MLRLNAPLWLHTSRLAGLAGLGRIGSAVPSDERVHFDERTLARLEGNAPRGGFRLGFSRRLGEQFALEGHLPVGFVDIVRTALEERGARIPLRLIASPRRADEEIVDGIGLTVENVGEVAREHGDRDAAAFLKSVALGLARHVAGIDAAEFAIVDDAVRAKYQVDDDGAIPADAARAAASIVAQFVEARTRESLSHDPAEQIALFVDALLRKDPECVFVIESPFAIGERANDPEADTDPGCDDAGLDAPAPAAAASPEAPRIERAIGAPIRGTVYSRDPATGKRGLVVCARRDDDPERRHDARSLARSEPDLLAALARRCLELETRIRGLAAATFVAAGAEILAFEPTPIELTPAGRLAVTVALVHEGCITREEAIVRTADLDLARIRPRGVIADGVLEPVASGVVLCPGAVSGRLAFSGKQALAYRRCGFDVVLVRDGGADASTLDLASAQGVVVIGGDASSPLARAARKLDLPAIGCDDLRIDAAAGIARAGSTMLREGESITLDAQAGCLFAGVLPIVEFPPAPAKSELHAWRVAESARVEQRA